MAKNILIIGGVALGSKVATRYRRLDSEANITLVDQDEFVSYGGCGIPYYLSGDVENLNGLRMTTAHVVRDPDFFNKAKDVKVRTRVKALKINREKKTVLVEDLNTNTQEELAYDKLVLGVGASARALPVEGADLEGVTAVTNLHQATQVHNMCASGKINNAVVIGAGFIGLEVAVALADTWGINVTVVEVFDQVLPTVSNPHSALIAKKDLEELGITVALNEKVMKIEGENNKVKAVITDKQSIEADLVISSIGFVPNTEIAKEAGLECIGNGAVKVDEYMRTSDKDIYAGGDCCGILNLITGKYGYLPLGSLANRQGRLIGSNLAGLEQKFTGYVGTWCVKLGKLSFAGVGLTLAQAQREGLDAISVIAEGTDHAHFYPDANSTTIELVVEKKTRRILGCQASSESADAIKARVDVVAMIMQFANGTLDELSNAEIAYAPPFASAMDIINTVSNVADNAVSERFTTISPNNFEELWGAKQNDNLFVVDARPANENALGMQNAHPDYWLNIPLEQIKERYNEIPKDKPVALVCSTGTRSYETMLVLKKYGYTNIIGSLLGGMSTIRKTDINVK